MKINEIKMTFGQLADMTPSTKGMKLPTAKKLMEEGTILIKTDEITVYTNGLYIYTDGKYCTVFGCDRCMGIPGVATEGENKDARNIPLTVPVEDCKAMEWYWPLMVMGMRRLDRNEESREASYCDFHLDNDGNDWDESCATFDFVERMMENLEEEETLARLAEALDKLTDRQREVVTLYYYRGLNQEEVARELGISQPAVQKNLTAAIKNLKKLMA